jgi:hypothetical protein
VKPVKVNVIIRDETSDIAMMWKTTIRDKRNYALCWNKKGNETMTNNITCNQTITVPSYLSILNWHDRNHNLPQQES